MPARAQGDTDVDTRGTPASQTAPGHATVLTAAWPACGSPDRLGPRRPHTAESKVVNRPRRHGLSSQEPETPGLSHAAQQVGPVLLLDPGSRPERPVRTQSVTHFHSSPSCFLRKKPPEEEEEASKEPHSGTDSAPITVHASPAASQQPQGSPPGSLSVGPTSHRCRRGGGVLSPRGWSCCSSGLICTEHSPL